LNEVLIGGWIGGVTTCGTVGSGEGGGAGATIGAPHLGQ